MRNTGFRVFKKLQFSALALSLAPFAYGASVSAGSTHTVIVKPDGTVWSFGANESGQLGDGGLSPRMAAVQVPGAAGFAFASAGGRHTVAVKADGTVYSWGANDHGQLGLADTTGRLLPATVAGLSEVVAVSAGDDFSLALKSDGTVWAWGRNDRGQLGDGSTSNSSLPVQVAGLTSVTKIAAGGAHALALTSGGYVYSWGANESRQVGDNGTADQNLAAEISILAAISDIAAGANHSLALKSDGTGVWAWGSNANGQLGVGSTTMETEPILASTLTSGVAAISAGRNLSFAVMTGGTVYAWGENGHGQIGDGSTTQRTSPVLLGLTGTVAIDAGSYHAIAVSSAGVVSTWGRNDDGRLGNGTTTPKAAPTSVSTVGYGLLEPVEWTNLVNTTANGNTLTRPVASAQWDAGGVSTRAIASPDGFIEFRLTTVAVTELPMAGLSNGDSGPAWDEIDFAFSVGTAGSLHVYEAGVHRGQVSTWAVNDVLRIGIEGGVVKYRKNGVLLYSSSVQPTYPLLFDSSIRFQGSIVQAVIAGALVQVGAGAPWFSPPPGTFAVAPTVTVTGTTPGATIRFTTDGSEPTDSSPSIESGETIQIEAPHTLLKAKAWGSGLFPSQTTVGHYAIGTSATEAVQWRSLVNATASGSTVTKTGGTSNWDSGASSTKGITSPDGYLQFSGNPAYIAMVGLSFGDTHLVYDDIDYAIYLNGGTVHVFEGGTSRGNFPTFVANDVFRVELEDGVVKYKKNGTTFYTSTVVPRYPLLVDASLRSVGAVVQDATLSGTLVSVLPEPVQWTNLVNVSPNGNSITKTSGVASTWDAGAVSTRAIGSGDGYVEFQATCTSDVMAGLSSGDAGASHTDIDFALYVAATGTLNVYEGGTGGGQFGTCTSTDVFRVAVENGVVKYRKNGTLLYTSAVSPTYPLLVDTSLHGLGSSVNQVVIAGVISGNLTDIVTAAPLFSPPPGVLTNTETIGLSSGSPGAAIYYTTNGATPTTASAQYATPLSLSGTTTIKAIAVRPGFLPSPVSIGQFSFQAAAPVLSPAGGPAYGPVEVSMASATAAAVIRYTVNGVEPSESSTTYTAPITVEAGVVVKARAFKAGFEPSPVATAAYEATLPPPVIAPASGPIGGPIQVTVSAFPATPGWAAPTVCSASFSDIAVGWRSKNWVAADCTNGLPLPGSWVVAQGRTGNGTAGNATCSGTTGSHYQHPSFGETQAEVRCLFVPPQTPTATVCRYYWPEAATGWRYRTWQAADCSNGLPPAGWASIADAQNGNGTAGQASCSATQGGHFNHGTIAGATSGQVTCGYFKPTDGDVNVCSHVFSTNETGWRSANFLASECSMGAPAAGAINGVGQASNGVGSGGEAMCSPATGWHYNHPTIHGATTGIVSCALVQPGSLGNTAIRFTVDGTEPTGASPIYSGAFMVSPGTTVKARSFRSGWVPSDIAESVYTTMSALSPPVATPSGGATAMPTAVALSAEAGAAIRYTLNGDEPTAASTLYTAPIQVGAALTLKSRAFKAGFFDSPVAVEVYTQLAATAPTITPAGGTFLSAQTVTMSASIPGVEIRYTTDGSTPTAASTLYSGAITVSSTTLVRAIAFVPGFSPSPEATAQITIALPQAVEWINVVGAISQGAGLVKTAPPGWGNSGASSSKAIVSGDGSVSTTYAGGPTSGWIFGLSSGDRSQAYTDGDFTVFVWGSEIRIWESGVLAATLAGPPATGDEFKVAVEGGVVRYYRNGNLLYTSSAVPRYPLLLDMALNETGATMPPSFIAGNLADVVRWQGVTGATLQGTDLLKTNTSGWGNAGASSSKAIFSGDGFVSTTYLGGPTSGWIFGLSNGDLNTLHTDGDFTIFVWGNEIRIWEAGTPAATIAGPPAIGDQFKVAVTGGVVRYYRNSTLLYTSAVAPRYPLVLDTALYENGATMPLSLISGNLVDVVRWTNVVGASTQGTSLVKTATTAGWGNSGGSSEQRVLTGDGFVATNYLAGLPTSGWIFGLNSIDAGQQYTDPDFAVFVWGAETRIWESGVLASIIPSVPQNGDLIRIAVEGGVVKYYRNTTLLYTSSVAPQYPLIADVALNETTASIGLAVIAGNSASPAAVPVQPPTFTPNGGALTAGQTVALASTTPGAYIRYTLDGSTPTSASTLYSGGVALANPTTMKAVAFKAGLGWTQSAVSSATFSPVVAAPTFSVAAGNYYAAQTVAITTATVGATIRYTTNGSEPTSGSTLYSAPVTIAQNSTLKAKAFLAGSPDSGTATASYALVASTPVITPGSGAIVGGQGLSVTMSTSTPGAQVRYTADGSTPGVSSTLYTGPLVVSTPTTLKVIALKTGWTTSSLATAAFNLGSGVNWSRADGTYVVGVVGADLSRIGGTGFSEISVGRYPLVSGSGGLQFSTSETNRAKAVGLGRSDAKTRLDGIDFGFLLKADGTASVVEGGIDVQSLGAYATTDVFRVAVEGPAIVFRRNGALVRTSTSPVTYPLFPEATLGEVGATVTNPIIDGATIVETVLWADGANVISRPGLVARSAPAQAPGTPWTAGAASTRAIASGDGYVQFKGLGGVDGRQMLALSVGDTGQSTPELMFAIYLYNGNATAYESGVAKGTAISIAATDVFRIEVQAGLLHYKRNGATFYTSLVAPTYPLRVDTSLFDPGYGFGDVILSGTLSTVGVRPPVLGVGTGTYPAGQSVSVTGVTPGSVLHQTTNGADPTTSDPTLSSGDALPPIETPRTVKARAVLAGYTNSSVASSQVFVGAVSTESVSWAMAVNATASGSTLTKSGGADAWDAGAVSTKAIMSPDGYVEFKAPTATSGSVMLGLSNVDVDQNYTDLAFAIFLQSGGHLSVYERGVWRGQQGTFTDTDTFRIALEGGVIKYQKNGATFYTSMVAPVLPLMVDTSLRGADQSFTDVALSGALQDVALAPPIASPTGGQIPIPSTVALSAAAGAAIRYTLNGDEPTAASTLYTAPIQVGAALTLKARAFKAGALDSAVATETYTQAAAGAPAITPAGGTYELPQMVALSTSTPGAQIRYTLDGSGPTTASVLYSEPLTVAATATVSAAAFKPGLASSPVSAESFVLLGAGPTAPSITPTTGSYSGDFYAVSIESEPGTSVWYTTDGSAPTAGPTNPASLPYTTSFEMHEGGTIKAIAVDSGGASSAAASSTVTLASWGDSDRTPKLSEAGAPAGSYALSGFETVNLYSGNLQFRLPLLNVRGRGDAGFGMGLAIAQTFQTRQLRPIDLNPGGPSDPPDEPRFYRPQFNRWQIASGYGPGAMVGRRVTGEGTRDVILSFVEADGTEHELRGASHNTGQPQPAQCQSDHHALAGSAATFNSDSTICSDGVSEFGPTGNLHLRDGRMYRIEGGLVAWMRDRNGNKLSFEYNAPPEEVEGLFKLNRVTRIVDSLGRTVDITYSLLSSGYDVISFSGAGGVARTIRVERTPLVEAMIGDSETVPDPLPEDPNHRRARTIGELFPMPAGFEWVAPRAAVQHNPTVARSVEIPDGRRYEFRYNRYGELVRADLPTGGVIEYERGRGLTSLHESGAGEGEIYRRVTRRRTLTETGAVASETQFGLDEPGPFGTRIIVRHHDPVEGELSIGRHDFIKGGLLSGKERTTAIYAGGSDPATAPALSVVENGWELEEALPYEKNPRLRWVVNSSGGVTSRKEFEYSSDGFNNQTATLEFDNGIGGNWGSLLRKTVTSYETAGAYTSAPIHLRSLPLTEKIFHGQNLTTPVAETRWEYDASPLEARPAAIGLAAGFSVVQRGNLTATRRLNLTDGGESVTRTDYDVLGNAVIDTDARGHQTQYSYADRFGETDGALAGANANCQFCSRVTAVTNALGHTAAFEYDFDLGVVTDSADANGVISSVRFAGDPLDRPTAIETAVGTASAAKTRIEYDDAMRLVKKFSDRDSFGDGVLRAEAQFDGLGRSTKAWQFEGSGWIETRTEYDGLGRVSRTSNPFRGAAPEHWTQTSYDALGRVRHVTAPDGAVTETEYNGNETTVTDPAHRKRTTVTDGLGRISKVIEDPGGALQAQTLYEYDPLGNLTKVTQDGQLRTFVYDALSRLRSATNPESGTTTYDYDLSDNLIKKVDARQVETHYGTYDALNRMTTRTYVGNATPNVVFGYDDPQVPFSKGRPTSVATTSAASGGAFYDAYDPSGRVLSHRQVTGGVTFATSATFNRAGAQTSITYPSGRTVSYSYDSAGRVSGVTGTRPGGSPETFVQPGSVNYAPHGAVASWVLGNGIVESTGFNERLQPNGISFDAGAPLLAINYGYSGPGLANNGNVLAQDIFINGAPNPRFQMGFTYDALNRLKTASEAGSWGEAFGYDRFGNRTKSGDLTAYSPIDNRIIGGDYDEVGNLVTLPDGQGVSYDAENRQVEFSSGFGAPYQYGYDGDGRRVYKRVAAGGQSTFVYGASGQLLSEVSNLSPGLREHIYAGSKLVAVTSGGEGVNPEAPPPSPCSGVVCPDGVCVNGACVNCSPAQLSFTVSSALPYVREVVTFAANTATLASGSVPTWTVDFGPGGSGTTWTTPMNFFGDRYVTMTAVESSCGSIQSATMMLTVRHASCDEAAQGRGYQYGDCFPLVEGPTHNVCDKSQGWVKFQGGGQCPDFGTTCCGYSPPCADLNGSCIDGQASACGVGFEPAPFNTLAGEVLCATCCVPITCTENSQCPTGEVCDVNGSARCAECTPTDLSQCSSGQVCNDGHCFSPLPSCSDRAVALFGANSVGDCRAQSPDVCGTDNLIHGTSCGGGQICCATPPECTGPGQCGGQICENYVCTACTSNSQCPGQVCDSNGIGACVECTTTDLSLCSAGQVCSDGNCFSPLPSCADRAIAVLGPGSVGECRPSSQDFCGSETLVGGTDCGGGQICCASAGEPDPCSSNSLHDHSGSCGNSDSCGHVFGTNQDSGCPGAGPSCGSLGGDHCIQNTSCPAGTSSLGQTHDCIRCCQNDPPPDPCSSNSLHDHSGSCGSSDSCGHTFGSPQDSGCGGPPSCGDLGGDHCSGSSSCPAGRDALGETWDCAQCCGPYNPPEMYCGDGACNNDEWCGSCQADCGSCGYCGDGWCDWDETWETCPADCANNATATPGITSEACGVVMSCALTRVGDVRVEDVLKQAAVAMAETPPARRKTVPREPGPASAVRVAAVIRSFGPSDTPIRPPEIPVERRQSEAAILPRRVVVSSGDEVAA